MNILLVNLTRFGDLLQMQPVILGLQAQGHNVGLVCLQNFAPATKLLRGLTYVCAVPGSSFLAKLESDWREAVQTLDDMLTELTSQFPVDKIFNTTATLGARLLSLRISLAAGGVPLKGFALDEDGYGETGDIWSMFLQAASAQRRACPFNLVDIFRAMAGVAHDPPLWGLQNSSEPAQAPTQTQTQAQRFVRNALAQSAVDVASVKGFVSFQLGASDARRQWPVEAFAALARLLWERHALCPILLGTAAEHELGEQYAAAALRLCESDTPPPPHINAIGRTDILLLAALLQETRLLVTNDTGTMHLAAGLCVPVLAIFLATAQACDTGPYLPGCCCLEPALACHPCNFQDACVTRDQGQGNELSLKDTQACLGHIPHEAVFYLVDHYIQHSVWPQYPQDIVRVWHTVQDAEGFAAVESLSGHENEERTLWLQMQKHFYRRIFDSTFSAPYSVPDNFPVTLRQDLAADLSQSATLLSLLEGQLLLFERRPHAEAGSRIMHTSNRIQALFEESRDLSLFAYIWKHITQQYGADLVALRAFIVLFRDVMHSWSEAVGAETFAGG